jgi:ribosomal 50S subunit-associated protein YjgA (DUF615 family)
MVFIIGLHIIVLDKKEERRKKMDLISKIFRRKNIECIKKQVYFNNIKIKITISKSIDR